MKPLVKIGATMALMIGLGCSNASNQKTATRVIRPPVPAELQIPDRHLVSEYFVSGMT